MLHGLVQLVLLMKLKKGMLVGLQQGQRQPCQLPTQATGSRVDALFE